MLLHDATRFPVFIPALKKPDFATLDYYFEDVFMNALIKCGAEDKHMNAAVSMLSPLKIDNKYTKSGLGRISSMKQSILFYIERYGLNVAELTGYSMSSQLATEPTSIMGKTYKIPADEMLRMLDEVGG